ncbi:LuxE/PaaK family acyltransferase [Brumimicrobium oceani]|uniref:Acyl transferase n=1 Tax=Brumimicrobium oceani TaxID=2100725 RepID=A0A2U2XD76_9FLAO|nr:acyl transferase [Brumimicrobium oceani]PWH85728.1 acyl transferase [Brumimicrobium oceani]
MPHRNPLLESVFKIDSETDFNRIALSVFNYQYNHVAVYRKFCNALGRSTPKHYKEIPFLPISFFKTHTVLSDEFSSDQLLNFKSSGTTQSIRSNHFLALPELYVNSFMDTFSKQMVDPKDAIVMALLPNYIEQGESSLVYMVDHLVKVSNHPLSGFYLSDLEALIQEIQKAKQTKKKIILFGVSYALLDLAEKGIDLSQVVIIETGGMKGRRKEMIKEELHQILCDGLNVKHIYSEYGMTELLSQGYTDGTEYFTSPNWMKVVIRDVNDPLSLRPDGKTGGVNVIDLANLFSCSFIATDDLGVRKGNRFKILGRFDQSDIRGCNLLVN